MPADKEDIKRMVSMSEVLTLFGFEPDRHGKLCCPFHSEKTPSMKIYDDGFYCYGCGVGGSIFDFVMRLENVEFPAALSLICTAFNIPNDKPSTSAQRQAITARRKQSEERKERVRYGNYAWNRLCAYRHYLIALDGYAPERWHSLEYLEYVLESYLSDMEGLALFLPDVGSWLKTRHAKYSNMKP